MASTMNMEESIEAVEAILKYKFKAKKLLEEALTHPSYTDAPSYQRLEFLGDSALGLAVSKFFFTTYPDIAEGPLTLLRAANVCDEKLARVAIRLGLYKYIRYNNVPVLTDMISEFVTLVEGEEEMVVHGGVMKVPGVLEDIVESVAGAVYVDCGFNLQMLWIIFRPLLEPLAMLDFILAQPQPISALYEACNKDGKQVDIRYQSEGHINIASVFVDDTFIASRSSRTKENAKLHAAKAALSKLPKSKGGDASPQTNVDFDESMEIEGAKMKVNELCIKRRWPKPTYRVDEEFGPPHDKRYASSIQVALSDGILRVKGNKRSRVKDAENSAASMMLRVLQEGGYEGVYKFKELAL
ncbi:hypothetical protein L1987_85359 [Smallanthus sonchifolius]|uniref:Uncharacterized protein n=1 Tax=Smallanthus sonchifolius TaxID=185202 RepID=A0ACB8XWJ2_9ASTR|nr:hypothetical protein L1987_85359 [Smallanthus sonchifolius]